MATCTYRVECHQMALVILSAIVHCAAKLSLEEGTTNARREGNAPGRLSCGPTGGRDGKSSPLPRARGGKGGGGSRHTGTGALSLEDVRVGID
jgi:hypothetical protein